MVMYDLIYLESVIVNIKLDNYRQIFIIELYNDIKDYVSSAIYELE